MPVVVSLKVIAKRFTQHTSRHSALVIHVGAVQVPEKIFVTDKLPKTATGKIQRRHMVTAFIKEGGGDRSSSSSSGQGGMGNQQSDDKGTGKGPSNPQPRSRL